MARIACPNCGKNLEVQKFGGAVKCPACGNIFPYAPEKKVRCPNCNRLTTINDVRGMEFICSNCHKSMYYTAKGDIVKNISYATIGVINLLGIIAIIGGGIFTKSACVCGSISLIIAAIDIYLFSLRIDNNPKVFIHATLADSKSNTDILKRLPLLEFLAFFAKFDGDISLRELEYIRRIVDGILRTSGITSETEIQKEIMEAIQYIKGYSNTSLKEIFTKLAAMKNLISTKTATDFTEMMCELGTVDGNFDTGEQNLVESMGSILGLSTQTIQMLISKYAAQGQKRTTREARRELTTREAYAILGLSSDAADAEIKKRYHELAKRYHPDLQTGKSKADKIHAEEMMKLISLAYNKVAAQNG